MPLEVAFAAEVWEYDGPSAWHFLTLPVDVAERVRQETDGLRRGFGSVRVEVSVGGTTWRTSVFPDSRSGSFLLPVKAEVRRREDLLAGDVADVTLRLLDG